VWSGPAFRCFMLLNMYNVSDMSIEQIDVGQFLKNKKLVLVLYADIDYRIISFDWIRIPAWV